MKTRKTIVTAILLALGFSALSPMAQAVSPAPDGGYPGANTAEGQNALLGLTSGTFNTAVGWFALRSATTGQFSTALGAGALFANTGDQNTATGAGALLSNTTGAFNTANGALALLSNTTGLDNTANGASALFSNTTGASNTATGSLALSSNTTGSYNAAIGFAALYFNTTGVGNTATGYEALDSNATGVDNTAIGLNALSNNTTGNNNIALGAGAGSNIHTASDTICIGIAGVDVAGGCYIGHVFEEPLDPDNLAMAIDVNGKVGTLPSSRRFKDNIKPMDKTSESILALKPVSFHYKNDKNCSPRFGLIAEEVADVDPNLVARDKQGKPFSVRYDQVNAMLLNEFLKEHRKVEKLEATVAQQRNDFQATMTQLKKEMESIVARSEKQDAKRQKVSAPLELDTAAPQKVANR